MPDKRFALLAPLFILFILTTGCIEQLSSFSGKSGGGGSGVFIEEFSSDQGTIFPLETTGINLKIGNGGEFVASDVKATLYGLGELDFYDSSATKGLKDLDPMDPSTGAPADNTETSWFVKAPADTTGTTGYTLGVRVDYNYGSDGWAEMLVTEKTQEKTKQQEGESTSTMGGITKAPVETQVYTPKFLLYREIENPVNVRVDLVNTGGGTVFCEDQEGEKHLDHACELTLTIPNEYLTIDATVGVAIDSPGADSKGQLWCCKPECDPDTNPSDQEYIWRYYYDGEKLVFNKSFSDPYLRESLELRGRGKYRSHVCWFKPIKENIGLEEKIPIRASSKYGYSSQAELLLAVHGKSIEGTR